MKKSLIGIMLISLLFGMSSCNSKNKDDNSSDQNNSVNNNQNENIGGDNTSGGNTSGDNTGENISGDNISGETPGGDNPGSETPGGDNPGSETPGGDNPGIETPGEDNPGSETPGGDNPGSETPGGDNPGQTVTPNLKLGYAGLNGKMPDFSIYENTSAYRQVSTYEELLDAIVDAKYHYTSTIKECEGKYVAFEKGKVTASNFEDKINRGLFTLSYITFEYEKVLPGATFNENTTYYEYSPYAKVLDYEQTPASGYDESNFKGTVRVIEITNDIDLGWKYVPEKYKPANDYANNSYVENHSRGKQSFISTLSMSDMFNECGGMSQIKIEGTNDLLIYSKSGVKLTHGGFSILSCDNVVFRNIEFDELWQWEDTNSASVSKIGDYDAFAWAYFKISFCGNVWIDHCEFGKSYDGQIDVSNPYYLSKGTLFRAPYGADGTSGVHISNCYFKAGSDDQNGYIYKMMLKIEQDYQNNGGNYLYYKALRDAGASFEDILYGIAIPQKKCFLDGDSSNEYEHNTNLRVSIANCKFKNIEDRIPKVRSGVVYMYNCDIDNLEYHQYRTKLQGFNAKSVVTSINSTWKCALVSQAIVCGNGGSVACKNVKFKGIEYLLKNNDSTLINEIGNPEATYNGGYSLINCSYQKSIDSETTTSEFTNESVGSLEEKYFKWRTDDGLAPFEVEEIDLSKLDSILVDCGVTNTITDWFNF